MSAGRSASTHTLEVRGGDARTARGRRIAALGPWFHNVHLPDGTQTAPDHPLGDFPRQAWRAVAPAIPEDLAGWSALDVGCNSGFYASELARRGARVVGIDVEERYLRQADFVLGEFGLRDRVELRRQSVYEVARRGERFDLVWFMGVLYHLRHPLLALDALAAATRRLLVVQSLALPAGGAAEAGAAARPPLRYEDRARAAAPDWPRMAFVEGSFAGDPTNWWIPDPGCLEAMVRSAGLRVVGRPGPEVRVCAPDPADRGGEARRRELAAATGGDPAS